MFYARKYVLMRNRTPHNSSLKLHNFLLFVHNITTTAPWIVTILLSSSSIVSSVIIIFAGDYLALSRYDEDAHLRLTLLGWILSVICWAISIIIQTADRFYQSYQKESATNAEAISYIRENVEAKIINVCNSKYNTLISLIHDIVSGKEKPHTIISKPCEQLKSITREIADCLRVLLSHNGYTLNENEIYVSIFYKFSGNAEWSQTHSAFPEKGMSVPDVATNSNSTFSHTLQNRNGLIFINDKQQGLSDLKYVPDSADKYDEDGHLKGSILCYRINCSKNGTEYITAVLSISTYEKRIEPSNSPEKVKNTQDNICKFILSEFEKRIRIELCLLYLFELKKQQRRAPIKSSKIVSIEHHVDLQ